MSKESRFNKKVGKKKATQVEMLLMFILIGIIPFLVYGIQIVYPQNGTLPEQLVKTSDYFIIVKSRMIRAVAAAMVIEKVAEYLTMSNMPKLDFKKMLKPVYILSGLIVLSTIIAFLFSDYKYIATRGALERYESIWIHFSYIIIFVYSINFFKKENSFKVFAFGMLLAAFVVGAIGTAQYFGYNPMEKDWFIDLTTNANQRVEIRSEGSFTTFYNTNTSGAYAVFMLFVLSIILVVYKDIKVRLVAVIDLVLIGITFINSNSEASYIAFVAGLGTAVILTCVLLFVNKKNAVGGALTAVVVAGGMVVIYALTSVPSIETKFNSMVEAFIGPEATFTDWKLENNELYFYNNDDDSIKFVLDGNSYELYEGDNLIYTDNGSVDVATQIPTEDFETITLTNRNINGEEYISFNDYFYIKNVTDNYMLVDNQNLAELRYVPFVGFEGYGNMFTNRGYIWSRSIPLLLDRPIVGYGADVYRFVFPNDDVVGKTLANQPLEVFIDKPHNIYLNMAINNGILYLVGYIGIVFIAFKNSFKLFFNREKTDVSKVAIILYISGLVVYLVNGISTDNIIITIAIFWVYLAIDNNIFSNKEFVEEKVLVTNSKASNKAESVVKNNKKSIKAVSKEVVKTENTEVKTSEELKEEIKEEDKEEINYDEIGVSYADFVSKDND